jgi:hypothetical protein
LGANPGWAEFNDTQHSDESQSPGIAALSPTYRAYGAFMLNLLLELIFPLVLIPIFLHSKKISQMISKFYSNYPLIRYLPRQQFHLGHHYIKIGAIIIFTSFYIAILIKYLS